MEKDTIKILLRICANLVPNHVLHVLPKMFANHVPLNYSNMIQNAYKPVLLVLMQIIILARLVLLDVPLVIMLLNVLHVPMVLSYHQLHVSLNVPKVNILIPILILVKDVILHVLTAQVLLFKNVLAVKKDSYYHKLNVPLDVLMVNTYLMVNV